LFVALVSCACFGVGVIFTSYSQLTLYGEPGLNGIVSPFGKFGWLWAKMIEAGGALGLVAVVRISSDIVSVRCTVGCGGISEGSCPGNWPQAGGLVAAFMQLDLE
jgi:hypothetical protein